MDPFVIVVVVGFAAVLFGLGVVRGVKYRGAEVDIEPNVRGGWFVILLGVIAFGVGISGLIGVVGGSPDETPATADSSATSQAPGESESTSPTTTPPATPPPETLPSMDDLRIELKAPAKNSKWPVTGGLVSGELEGDIGTRALWLFTLSDGKWYLNQQIPVNADGSFEVTSGQVGDPSEVNIVFTFSIVVTNESQTSLINEARPNADGDVYFDDEPGRVLASRAIVRR